MTCFKSFALAFALLLPPLFSGCGYRIGARSLVHPQLKSIAVGEIKNDTPEPHPHPQHPQRHLDLLA